MVERGKGKKVAYLLEKKVSNDILYFSEKNFSLGEISIIRLVRKIQNSDRNSLILIDELEMAIYPKIQINLLRYLKKISEERSLTIIISTHSSSMIKEIDRNNIYFLSLEKNNIIKVTSGCYPAVILNDLTYGVEIAPDYLFFVEDRMAYSLLKGLVDQYWKLIQSDNTNLMKPMIRIIPIGGFQEVVNFLSNSKSYLFPSNIKCYAFLDEDAKNTIQNAKKPELIKKYRKYESMIKYLPVTPELGFIELYELNNKKVCKELEQLFDISGSPLQDIISSEKYLKASKINNPRTAAKDKFSIIVEEISENTNSEISNVESKLLSSYYVEKKYFQLNSLQAIFKDIFK